MESLHPHGDSVMFHNEWMEVEVPCQEELLEDSGIASPTDKIPCQNMDDAPYIYKDVYVDVDVSKKSDRQEWGHVRYQSVYKPDEAFEVTGKIRGFSQSKLCVAKFCTDWTMNRYFEDFNS